MRRLLSVFFLVFIALVSLGQDAIYWPDHGVMRLARWSPDGSQIATWGEYSLVRIWNDHDGALALELDHSDIRLERPRWSESRSFLVTGIRDVNWSEDASMIFTQVVLRDFYVYQVAWTADTGEALYSFFWGTDGINTINAEHHVLPEKGIVASWNGDLMSFINIDPTAETFGKRIATINSGKHLTPYHVRWSEGGDEALILYYPSCTGCLSNLTLIDTEIDSATFGEFLWLLKTPSKTGMFAWPNAHDLLTLHDENLVELWDLDRESARFASRILGITLEDRTLYEVLYDEDSKRLLVVQVEVVTRSPRARDYLSDIKNCIVHECEFLVDVRDVEFDSPTFGQQVTTIRHPYRLRRIGDGFQPADRNRVVLNQSATQVHFYIVDALMPNGAVELEKEVAAYDLVTGDAAVARHRLPDTAFYTEPRGVVDIPQIKIDLGLDTWDWYWRTMTINPDGNKVIIRLKSTHPPFKQYWLIQNIETGEFFYPPDTWSDTIILDRA